MRPDGVEVAFDEVWDEAVVQTDRLRSKGCERRWG